MRIELPGLVLRDFVEADAASLARHANNRKVWRNLRDGFPHPYLLEDARRFLARWRQGAPPSVLCLEVGGEAAGAIGYHTREDVERFSAELGYWLAEPHWGRGLMSAAVRAVSELALGERGLERLVATPFAWNPASCRVLEKAGFQLEGRLRRAAFKDGQWVDELVYARLRG
ncbi:MAG TPA: GNAT family protein [Myxococcota bacterium]|nr:GNAT family protein [Myxococcota bacterium]HRY94527.1 GNAT family protein [Myxococcota bacterium]HSA20026.1 GNAT family protein [Myxococcota bacterium]